jgi:hypothetical protein
VDGLGYVVRCAGRIEHVTTDETLARAVAVQMDRDDAGRGVLEWERHPCDGDVALIEVTAFGDTSRNFYCNGCGSVVWEVRSAET